MTRLAALLLAALLAACSTTPSVPPLLSLGDRACDARPALDGALVVMLKGDKVSAMLDGTARCVQDGDAGRSTYAVFRLPEAPEPYQVGVSSLPMGVTLFSPRLMLLDGQGSLLREVPRDSFVFRGTTLHAGLRARPGELYLVVASDPGSVGRSVSQIAGVTRMTSAPVGVGVIMIHTGSEATNSFAFAHNGTIEVKAEPLPNAN